MLHADKINRGAAMLHEYRRRYLPSEDDPVTGATAAHLILDVLHWAECAGFHARDVYAMADAMYRADARTKGGSDV